MSSRKHCVYYLYEGRCLLYVGRSINPVRRKRVFERKHDLSVTRQKIVACESLEEACALELAEMNKLRPPYNVRLYQSNAPRLGMVNSPEMRAKISAANKGRKRMPEAAEKRLASGWKMPEGFFHTQKARAAIGKGAKTSWAKKTPEERAAIAQRGWEVRRRNQCKM